MVYIGFRNVMSQNEKTSEAYIELKKDENIIVNDIMIYTDGDMMLFRYCEYKNTQDELQRIQITSFDKPTIDLL